MPKTTLSKLSYQGSLIRPNGIVVKAFDGTRRTVVGEVDLPIQIGPQVFKITFQVMDIHPAYSCLLGRPWIHQAKAVSSTLHQRLKFAMEDKIVTVYGEQAMIISNLSSFRYIDVGEALGTQFQALEIETVDNPRKRTASITSLKDAQSVIQAEADHGWGKVIQLPGNKKRTGLGPEPIPQGATDPQGFP